MRRYTNADAVNGVLQLRSDDARHGPITITVTAALEVRLPLQNVGAGPVFTLDLRGASAMKPVTVKGYTSPLGGSWSVPLAGGNSGGGAAEVIVVEDTYVFSRGAGGWEQS